MQTKNTDIERPKKILEAIRRLRPNAQFALREETIEWHDKQQSEPTQEEIETEIAYLESEEYKKEEWRKTTYISRRQFKIGSHMYIFKQKSLAEHIEEIINQLPEPKKTIAKISQEEASNFKRSDVLLCELAKNMGMSDEEIDKFFIYCKNEEWKNL